MIITDQDPERSRRAVALSGIEENVGRPLVGLLTGINGVRNH